MPQLILIVIVVISYNKIDLPNVGEVENIIFETNNQYKNSNNHNGILFSILYSSLTAVT
jgi:hypothetical protein